MSQEVTKKASPFLVLLGIGMFIGGIAGVWFVGIKPILKTLDARDWPTVPCRIISAELVTHEDSDGTSYTFAIKYKYTYEGQTYSSGRYSFVSQEEGDKRSKRTVVKRYEEAEEPVCYVNPEDPSEAVLMRGFHKGYLNGLVPLFFICIGLFIVSTQLEAAAPLPMVRKTADDWLPKIKAGGGGGARHADTPVTLHGSRITGVLVTVLFFNLVCNIMASGIYFDLYQWIVNGVPFERSWGVLVVPAMSVLLTCMAVHVILLLFNPRPIIHISSARIRLGSSGVVRWSFRGRASSIERLNIALVGKEWMESGSGKDRRTSERVFRRIELIDSEDSYAIRNGRALVAIPEDTMHSFETGSKKIIWQIVVRGVVRFWPDVNDEIKIAVVPMGISEGRE